MIPPWHIMWKCFWPQLARSGGPRGPERAKNGPKNEMFHIFGRFEPRNGLRGGRYQNIKALFVSELRSFFQWPLVVFYRFPICVSAQGPPKRARIALDHLNHMGKGSTWCTRIICQSIVDVCRMEMWELGIGGKMTTFLALGIISTKDAATSTKTLER